MRREIVFIALLICVSTLIFAAKSPVDVASRHNDECAPAVAYNWLEDEFLVVWHEDRLDEGDFNIYGRIEGSDGLAKTDVFKITSDASAQKYPDVDYNRIDNEYLVVWQDERNGNYDIMAARIDADGNKVYPDITYMNASDSTIVVSNNTAKQEKPKVAHNYTDNCYLVVWQDERDVTESPVYNIDIYSQRLDADGEILPPSITLSPSVNYPITSGMVPLGGMDVYDYAREQHPDVAYHGSEGTELNEWLVVYERFADDFGSRIFATRINGPSGYHLNSFGYKFDKMNESISKSAFTPIFYLPFWCEGMPVGFPVIPTDPQDPYPGYSQQYSPHVISNSVWYPEGLLKMNEEDNYPVPEFLVAWTDFRSSDMNENPNIYCQRVAYFPDSTAYAMGMKGQLGPDSLMVSVLLDSLGNPPTVFTNWIEWANYPVTTHPNFQSWNDLAFNQNTGEYLVVWNDWRDSEWDGGTSSEPMPQADIYGQRLYINPADSALIWIDADDNWYADPAVNMPVVNTDNDEGDMQYPGIDCGVAQSEFLIAYEFDLGPTDANQDIQATFYPDEYVPTSVDEAENLAVNDFIIATNYPNPFNPSTTIHLQLPAKQHTLIKVYDVLGVEITTLLNGTVQAKELKISWDGFNSQGRAVSSGVYFYKVISGDYSVTKKMMLMR